MKHTLLTALLFAMPPALAVADALRTKTHVPVEITFVAALAQAEPFLNVTLDVVFTDPVGARMNVPAFWAGGNQWKVRYASPLVGGHSFRSQCSATDDAGLHGIEGRVEVVRYDGDNLLYRRGPVRVSGDRRHFEHADGSPFLWLGDTWWKCLCKRMTWEGFQELTADRKAKGFNAVQIVCGPYPGSTQLGIGKKLLEQYAWSRFEVHPEWAEKDSFAAGIPGQVRFIYQPKRGIYNWTGTIVKGLEPNVSYSAFYFDPATGRRFDQGSISAPSGEYKSPRLPSPQDWVLVLENKEKK